MWSDSNGGFAHDIFHCHILQASLGRSGKREGHDDVTGWGGDSRQIQTENGTRQTPSVTGGGVEHAREIASGGQDSALAMSSATSSALPLIVEATWSVWHQHLEFVHFQKSPSS